MYNITIKRDEIAFLREAIANKYCSSTKEDPRQFLQRITGSIKYYDDICTMMQDQLDTAKVSDYITSISDGPFKITLRKWLQQREDERNRKQNTLANSISGNVLRKLIFYGLQQPDLTFKDSFIMACYIYTGVDRNEWLASRKMAGPAAGPSSGTLPPDAFRGDGAGNSRATLPPFIDKVRCSLVAIDNHDQQMGERLEMVYAGQPLVLNRDNLGPDNNTITSQVQATLQFKDGEWILENGSRYKTTYIQVIKPATIQNGDILVFGNKRFLFREDQD